MELFNVRKIQSQYRPAMQFIVQQLIAYFGDRLLAIYLTGSVAYGEALVGVSDVDTFIFLDVEPSASDLAWCDALRQNVVLRFPVATDYLLAPHALELLERESFWRYALRYNSLQLYGTDILAALESRGFAIEAPSHAFALNRLGWMKPLLESLRGGSVPEYVYHTPEMPCLAVRKLARYFVLLEGAYLLMLDDQFISFRSCDVLPALRANYPQWETLYQMTDAVLRDPYTIAFSVDDFLRAVIPFYAMAVNRVEEPGST